MILVALGAMGQVNVPTFPISIAHGGTNGTTATAGFDNLAPTTTAGDLIYRNGSNNVRLAIGSTVRMVQTVNAAGTAPEWVQRPSVIVFYNPSVTTTNIPAGVQEYGNNTLTRFRTTLGAFKESRVQVNIFTAAPAGGNMRVQYSTDDSTFNDLTTNASLTAVGRIASTWSDIPAGALSSEDYLRIVTSGGNGAQSPVTVQVVLELR